jgi:glycosyltransferase involved in cell wall biosynthesis
MAKYLARRKQRKDPSGVSGFKTVLGANQMKILLSAYACEPHRGSEPEVGWNWALELAKMGHQVWVLTRSNNRQAIEAELPSLPAGLALQFIYFDLPNWIKRWKKGGQGVQGYYFLWQLGAFWLAKTQHHHLKFEQVHHVTFVSIRQPSLMGLLGIPFVFGPVSGGEKAPYALRKSFPAWGWRHDFFRDCLNTLIRVDPLMHLTFLTARRIVVTSSDTLNLLPGQYKTKAGIHLAIGLPVLAEKEKTGEDSVQPQQTGISAKKPLSILFVGNLLYLKGIHLALAAFAKLLKTNPDAHFTLIGSGRDEPWLKQYLDKLSGDVANIEQRVTWVHHMPRLGLLKQYAHHDIFLFPSLHDSGGMVVLEALSCGLPVLCLDIGGPGQVVTPACGYVLSTRQCDEAMLVAGITRTLQDFVNQPPAQQQQMKLAARHRASQLGWSALVSEVLAMDKQLQLQD